jgi:hypothetical protein
MQEARLSTLKRQLIASGLKAQSPNQSGAPATQPAQVIRTPSKGAPPTYVHSFEAQGRNIRTATTTDSLGDCRKLLYQMTPD